MRSTWHHSPVGRGRERFLDSFRGWIGHFNSVTHFIVWVTAIAFIAQLVCDLFRWQLVSDFGTPVSALSFIFGLNGERLAHGFIWQPVTYMLLHDGIWHVLMNLLMLWMFGREVEYFIGPKAFARLYILAGLLGGALWLAFNFTGGAPLLGASAAVLGCVIAFATLFPERELTFLIFFVLPVSIRAKYIALIAIAFDVAPLVTHQTTNVAHLAHLGGAAFGYFFIKALGYGIMPRWLLWSRRLAPRRSPSKAAPKPAPLTRDQFISSKVDPILDKISRSGMQSLTREERKILESAKDLMQKQQR